MATSTLFRALRCSSTQRGLRLATSVHLQLVPGYRNSSHRQLSVFNEFSKKLKGEAKSNQEFQQSVKDLNEKIGVVKEDLKVRTRKTAEKLYKSVDDVWTEAEETSKKVSANVKEKISAAKEEVKGTFGLGNEEALGSTEASSAKDATGARADQSQESVNNNNNNNTTGDDTLFGKFKSTFSSASPMVSTAFQKLKEAKVSTLAKKGYDIVKDELSSDKTNKRHMQYASASTASGETSTRTDIVVVPTKRSRLGEKWESFKKKMQDHPVFKRVTGYTQPVVNKGQELAEDVRERWETSDNPVVHKIQDLNETVFGETATALSFKEIRRRDPSFSLPDFVAEVQEMIRPVLTSYVKADIETLKKYCTREVIERCKGERTAYQAQGIFYDNKILHISEVDVRETKMMGSSPIIILSFQTQQIYCVRDREGNITDGGQDTIQNVYYLWAMQLIDPEELGEGAYYPVWRLREMQQQGIQALI
ncbi:mitochondrial import inner membrane translocase subunit TIM44-2-like isoform X1 [Ananas comosus]|uniref:Mitochondrial import inner membrane translocase subunit TIM44-2-like isoform X1 n=1 Tax=Ananas comosus TaxID=4615 RepID=A0A6P5F6U4_ANACO|nr:mitochondrial import inner membrane translocase subunit TIM44-2-like isoform X1 [Ananas comosus]